MVNFIGIIGAPGSGKTNLLTKYCYEYSQAGWPIAANYGLRFDYVIKGFSELAKLPADLNGCFVGVDELAVGADSYDFMSSDSKEITDLVAEIRKRHCLVTYSVQYFPWIAKRLRTMTDAFIVMEDNDKHIAHCKHFHNPKLCPGLPTCSGYICAGNFHRVFLDNECNFIREDDWNGAPYWSLYDSSEIVVRES